ncbi:MAG: MBL fold metallo-hydrolase, partial [Euryarchaeota archaeon]|nr:MBL fold metallo-hydrolase [Euryarchaeota archaeon]
MNIGFRNANPRHGDESYYITIEDGIDGQRACLLVDSGPGVRVERDLGSDEYLAGILLTHAHLDHYRTLGENVRDGAKIHTSPSTAAIVDRLSEIAASEGAEIAPDGLRTIARTAGGSLRDATN